MKKILIVEDDTSISEELKNLLDNAGFNGVILKDFENCFDSVKVSENDTNTSFDIDTSEKFYMLIKERDNQFKYVYKNENGEEISILLEYL